MEGLIVLSVQFPKLGGLGFGDLGFRVEGLPQEWRINWKRKWKMKWKVLYIGLYKDYMSYNLNLLRERYTGLYRGFCRV